MKFRTCIGALSCAALLLGSLSACSSPSAPADKPTATTTTTRQAPTTTALPTVGYIHNHATLIRSGAGLVYKALCGIEAGEQVAIISKNGDWYEVQYQGVTGYVSGQFLRFTPWDPNTTTSATSPATAATPSSASAAASASGNNEAGGSTSH